MTDDGFGGRLSELAEQAGKAGRLGPPAQIRKRGDQRRRRQVASSALLSLAVLGGLLAGVSSLQRRAGPGPVPPALPGYGPAVVSPRVSPSPPAHSTLDVPSASAAPSAQVPAPDPKRVADGKKIVPTAWLGTDELARYGTESWRLLDKPQLDEGHDDQYYPCNTPVVPDEDHDGQWALYSAKVDGEDVFQQQYTMFFRSQQSAVKALNAMIRQLQSCPDRQRGAGAKVTATVQQPDASAWSYIAKAGGEEYLYLDAHVFFVRAGSTVTILRLQDDRSHSDYAFAQDQALLSAIRRHACSYDNSCR